MKFIERENEIIKSVRKLSNFRIIIVGGYAVSARAKHRFSVDCDIVISKNNLKEVAEVLLKEGYEKTITKEGFDAEYGGEFVRFVKKVEDLPVSIDLLVNALVSRTTSASWSYDYILKHSNKVVLAGVGDSVECLVPDKELLIAFKIHAGRKTDIRDIIMLSDADWAAVEVHAKRANIDKLKVQIENMIRELEDEKLVDSLKGVFELEGDVKKMISFAKKKLSELLKRIQG